MSADGGDDGVQVISDGDGLIGAFALGGGAWSFVLDSFDVDAGVVLDSGVGVL